MKYSGIILAGGKSTRMGTDKALVSRNGTTMLQRSIDVLRPLCEDLLIVSNNADHENFGIPVIADVFADSGPVGGIHAGLVHARQETCFALSCDIPNLSTEILRALLSEWTNEKALAATCDGKVHPLIGIYRKSTVSTIEAFLKNDRLKLRDCFDALDGRYLEFSSSMKHHFINVNTPLALDTWEEK